MDNKICIGHSYDCTAKDNSNTIKKNPIIDDQGGYVEEYDVYCGVCGEYLYYSSYGRKVFNRDVKEPNSQG